MTTHKPYFLMTALFTAMMLVNYGYTHAQWQQTNGLPGGKVNTFAQNDTALYAGTDTAGVFISVNNGLNWNAVNAGLSIKNVNALVANGNNMVAGMGAGFGSGATFVSQNKGINWSASTNPYFGYLYCMIPNGNDILAGTWAGVIKSVTNGDTWSSLPITGLPSNASVSALVLKGTTLYAGVSSSSVGGTGVFMASSVGGNWSAKNTGLTSNIIKALAVNGNTLFAGTSNGGVFVSTNNGDNWSAANNGLSGGAVYSFLVNGANVFVGTNQGIFVTSNNGSNWTNISVNLPANTIVSAITIKDNYIFAGTNNNVWRRPISEVTATSVEPINLAESGLEVYPNPAKTVLYVKLLNPGNNDEITLTDISGKQLYKTVFQTTEHLPIDISGFKSGMYLLHVKNEGQISTVKKVWIE